MNPATLPNPLHGIIPPMITPLHDQDTLDVEGLERLVEHLIGGGVHGIFLLGTTGEAPSLSYRLRRELIRRTCRFVGGRVPLLVGITDASPVEAQRLAHHAAAAGADAVVLAAPFYFPIEQSELVAYVADLVPRLPLPVLLYNMPSHTKIGFTPDAVRGMLDIPQVIGLKDSSAGARCFHEVRELVARRRPEFSLLVGSEELLAETVPLGAHGGVCGGANVFPRLFADLYDATIAGDGPRISEFQMRVLQLRSTIYAVSSQGYAAIRGIKGALAHMGVCEDFVASPLHALNDRERELIAHNLVTLGVALARSAGRRPLVQTTT
jgi:dihydrodipicolinate synthase/N-acetylneuraminate lyase